MPFENEKYQAAKFCLNNMPFYEQKASLRKYVISGVNWGLTMLMLF